jgi:hypothetical protein
MALFEVISNTRDKNPDTEVTVPNWIKPGHQNQQAEAQEPQVQDFEPGELDAPDPEAQTAPVQEEVAAPEPEAEASPDAEAENAPTLQTTSTWEPRRSPEEPITSDLPIWSTSGGRLVLSLNYVSCLVASTGILLLIIVAFWLGHKVGSSPAAPPGANTERPVVKRQVGKFYMVIETLDGRTKEARAEADRIVKFCKANGEPAEVQFLKPNLIVWSLTPFDSKLNEEVRAHALSIQNELGVKYARKYGSKYKFNQPVKNGKLVPVMYPYGKSP